MQTITAQVSNHFSKVFNQSLGLFQEDRRKVVSEAPILRTLVNGSGDRIFADICIGLRMRGYFVATLTLQVTRGVYEYRLCGPCPNRQRYQGESHRGFGSHGLVRVRRHPPIDASNCRRTATAVFGAGAQCQNREGHGRAGSRSGKTV